MYYPSISWLNWPLNSNRKNSDHYTSTGVCYGIPPLCICIAPIVRCTIPMEMRTNFDRVCNFRKPQTNIPLRLHSSLSGVKIDWKWIPLAGVLATAAFHNFVQFDATINHIYRCPISHYHSLWEFRVRQEASIWKKWADAFDYWVKNLLVFFRLFSYLLFCSQMTFFLYYTLFDMKLMANQLMTVYTKKIVFSWLNVMVWKKHYQFTQPLFTYPDVRICLAKAANYCLLSHSKTQIPNVFSSNKFIQIAPFKIIKSFFPANFQWSISS